ncbi:hypothetical protein TRIUR3_31739 [Triticum urartu]|uniref:Late embryogenesis abundant protein LEA-2 subgroup domain-containing protein n=1 Tax=Triticum urartu TaxID=4572 RepID=M7YFJ9_TRIUA|nr:uncharacterized protein LOC125530569 [Triticum urartu]EMS45511.1 hypothetical protein TRIUR3_31739 [Triticum urartu]
MATTTSSSRSSHRLRDLCCDLQAQRNASSLLKGLLFTLPALAVLAAGVLLLLRFAVAPQIKAYVQDARLSSFAPAGARAYNISVSVALTVRNPNGAMAIKYTKPLVATFLFDDRRLYNVTVADEGYDHKPLKRDLHLLRGGGEVPYVLDPAAAELFKKQNATGVFKVEMRLSVGITLGIGNNRGLELSCPLALRRPPPPVPGPDPDDVVFHEVECIPDKPRKIVF